MIDFHTHILPNMDDGPKSVSESLEMLNLLEKQNVRLVFLTSHFYPSNESIDDYLLRRDKAYKELNYHGNLELKLGCELHYYNGISQSDKLEKLCLGDSNILLLELPFDTVINANMVNEITSLNNRGIRVMIAHIERYDVNEEKIIDLRSRGILIQANCEYIIGSLFDHKGLQWLKKGYIDVIGSDCHNLGSRKPNYLEAINKIKNKFGEDFYCYYIDKSCRIIGI